MARRTRNAMLVLAIGALVAAGCGRGGDAADVGAGAGVGAIDSVPTTTTSPARPLLYVGTPSALTALHPDTGDVAFGTSGVVAAPDWTRLWSAQTGPATKVIAADASTGSPVATTTLPGAFAVRVVSQDGRTVALSPPSDRTVYPALAQPRTMTTLATATIDPTGAALAVRQWEVPGNVEPEAFFTDGSLAVIDFVPPEAPVGYRVRRFDPASGTVVDIDTDENDGDAMNGTARTHLYGPGGDRLYTFYRVRDDLGATRAFVHVLDLRQMWAHCIDLPQPFGMSPNDTTALTMSPDGTRLYVADSLSGSVAAVDTVNLSVDRVGSMAANVDQMSTSATTGDDGTIFVAAGGVVQAIDPATLTAKASWPVAGTATALRIDPLDAGHVFVALAGRIAVLNSSTGQEDRSLAVPSVDQITFLGPGSPPLPESLSAYQCAC